MRKIEWEYWVDGPGADAARAEARGLEPGGLGVPRESRVEEMEVGRWQG